MRRRASAAWTSLPLAGQVAVVLLGLVFTVLIFLLVFKWLPESRWFETIGQTSKDRSAEIGRNRTAILALLAGLIAVAGAIFTGLSYGLNRSGQITERFTRAIDQLGNDKLDIRLGGIYALERIARDSRDDHPQVVEVLTAYVRQHAPLPDESHTPPGKWRPPVDRYSSSVTPPVNPDYHKQKLTHELVMYGIDEGSPKTDSAPQMPTDVQAAMSVLGRRHAAHDRKGAKLILARTDLGGLVLRAGADHQDEANLQGANLDGANLQSADLSGVNLQEATLTRANLHGANLNGANLQKATLIDADLRNARLFKANLQATWLNDADLRNAYLSVANLQHANLIWANLQGADLADANLQNARLDRAILTYAVLVGAKLGRANLTWANLLVTLLFQADLHGAELDHANLQYSDITGAKNLQHAVGLDRANLAHTGIDPENLPEG